MLQIAEITGTKDTEFADLKFIFPLNTAERTIDAEGNANLKPGGGVDPRAHEGKGSDGG